MQITVVQWNEMWREVHEVTSDQQHDKSSDVVGSFLIDNGIEILNAEDPNLYIQAAMEIGFLLGVLKGDL